MDVLQGIEALSTANLTDPIATIGVFDGVHRGHRHLFQELQEWRDEGEPGDLVAVTFDTHPRAVLGQISPVMLTSLDHRLVLLENLGLDAVVVIPFTKELSSWSPEQFARVVFQEGLGCRRLLMGFDSAFGQGAEGTADYLENHPEVSLEIRRSRPFLIDGHPVSSTEIRNAVLKGELERAEQLLGRPVSLYGEVIHGDGRGRTLGFPTANLNLFHSAGPPHGVYIADLRVEGERYGALVNIGRRPTFLDRDVPLDYSRYFNEHLDKVEVYIHEFDESLYGDRLEVALHRKLRDERRFENSEALIAQIEADVTALREWLASGA